MKQTQHLGYSVVRLGDSTLRGRGLRPRECSGTGCRRNLRQCRLRVRRYVERDRRDAARRLRPHLHFSIKIAAGLITLPGYAGFSGHVEDGGSVRASAAASGTHVTASGNLAAGRGQWNSRSKDGTCAGYWTAHSAAR